MVDEPVVLRRKHRVESGLAAVIHAYSQCQIPRYRKMFTSYCRKEEICWSQSASKYIEPVLCDP